jgi:hypothetical protein
MMDIIKSAKSLNLPDWWICAGFVRSKIWYTLHYFNERTPIKISDYLKKALDKTNAFFPCLFTECIQILLPTYPVFHLPHKEHNC